MGEPSRIRRKRICIRRQASLIHELLYQGKRGRDHGLRSDERRENRKDVKNPKQGSVVAARNCKVENIRKNFCSIDDETRALPKVS